MIQDKNFIGIDDKDMPIYRIFPLVRALDLFSKKKNALVHPELWDDPFENIFLNARFLDNGEPIDIDNVKKSWFGQCWTELAESDAMWRIYSPEKSSVRIQTTPKKIIDSMVQPKDDYKNLKYFIGKVVYDDSSSIKAEIENKSFMERALGGQNHEFAKTLLIKRNEFKHEQEIRVLFNDVNNNFSEKNIATFDFDPNSLIDNIMLDPRLDERVASGIESAFRAEGCICGIDQSSLYEAPSIEIDI